MEPYWFVPDADMVQAAAQQLEASAGEVWKYVAMVLGGVVVVLAGIIWKDVQEDKKDAKDREAQLNVMLANALNRKKGGDS